MIVTRQMFHNAWQVVLLLLVLLIGCAPTPGTTPESDSEMNWDAEARIVPDTTIYAIAGIVVGESEDVIKGQEPTRVTGSAITTGAYTAASGTIFPGDVVGKGLLRLKVENAVPSTQLAPVGGVVMLKTTDLKVKGLLPGDYVVLLCRAQVESVAAIVGGEKFDPEVASTFELDYCRMKNPIIGLPKDK